MGKHATRLYPSFSHFKLQSIVDPLVCHMTMNEPSIPHQPTTEPNV